MSLVALDDRYNCKSYHNITFFLLGPNPYFKDKLPPLVDAVRKNWERTLQSGLILVSLGSAFFLRNPTNP
jgi:hypothetical protein